MTDDTPPFERDDLVTLRHRPEVGVYRVVDCSRRGRDWWAIAFRITPRRPGGRRDEALFHGSASELIPYDPARRRLNEMDTDDE